MAVSVKVMVLYTSDLQPGIRVPPGVHEDILGGRRKHVATIKTKYKSHLKLEPALILALNEDCSAN
jgi:hypothetical protein